MVLRPVPRQHHDSADAGFDALWVGWLVQSTVATHLGVPGAGSGPSRVEEGAAAAWLVQLRSDAFLAAVTDAIAEHDKDRSGDLDARELRALLTRLVPSATLGELAFLEGVMDVNHDGRCAAPPPPPPGLPKERWTLHTACCRNYI